MNTFSNNNLSPVVYIGSMTGTSVDKQADFTAASFSSDGKLLQHENRTVDLTEKTRELLYHLSVTPCDQLSVNERMQGEIAITDFLIDAYRHVIQAFGLENHPKEKIILSPHGQTIDHQPDLKTTDQLVHGERLSAETGYPVVFRHRQACIAHTQAAPLAPVLLRILFDGDCVLVNGGGVANLCIFENEKTIAFDSGPANGPLDELIKHILKTEPGVIPADLAPAITKAGFDVSGNWAKRGTPCEGMKNRLLAHPYFSNPQSADRSWFNLEWVLKAKENANWEDSVTTLSVVIAQSIAQAVKQNSQSKTLSLGFYGGLRYNEFIIDTILSLLSDYSITLIDWEKQGLNPDFIESLLMAYLGFCVHQRRAVDLSYCAYLHRPHRPPVFPAHEPGSTDQPDRSRIFSAKIPGRQGGERKSRDDKNGTHESLKIIPGILVQGKVT